MPLEVLTALLGHHSLHQTRRYAQLYDTTKRQPDDQAMAAITHHHALGGQSPMAPDAIPHVCAYVPRRNYSPHTVDN
jgi:integrase/recombinase XerD